MFNFCEYVTFLLTHSGVLFSSLFRCSNWILSRPSRYRGVSMENLPGEDFQPLWTAIYRVTSLSWVRVEFELRLSQVWFTKIMPVFYRNFHRFFNFYYCLFMTGVGTRYSPALGNETGRTLLENTVHMFFESTVQKIWRKETMGQ